METSAESAPERMTLNDALAEEIRVAIARRRIKQRELCEVLGLSHGQVSQRLGGSVPLRADEIDLIASYLGVGVAELVKRADDARTWINAGMGDPWAHGEPAPAEQVMVERGILTPHDELPRQDSNLRPFVSQSPQVNAVATVASLAPITHLIPLPPVPQPQATTTTKKATAPVGGAVVVDLVTYRAGRRAGTRRATTRRPA